MSFEDQRRSLAENARAEMMHLMWTRLHTAHSLMRQARIGESMSAYRQAWRNLPGYLSEPDPNYGWAFLSDHPDMPSQNWACVYLLEYHINRRVWSFLQMLANHTIDQPEFARLPDVAKSRVISAKGYADIRDRRPTEGVIALQRHALSELRVDPFSEAMHCLVLGQAYLHLERIDTSIAFLDRAESLLNPADDPFYLLQVIMHRARSLERARYLDEALREYERMNRLIAELGEHAEPESPYYGMGWVYYYKDEYERALEYFARGEAVARRYRLDFDLAMYRYGTGTMLVSMGDRAAGISALSDALGRFRTVNQLVPDAPVVGGEGVSRIMIGLCLFSLSEAYRDQGDLSTAIRLAHDVLRRLHGLNDASQWVTNLDYLASLYRRAGQPRHALWYARRAKMFRARQRRRKILTPHPLTYV